MVKVILASIRNADTNAQLAADSGYRSDGQIADEREQSPDYAVRLRAHFRGTCKQALVSREDALGAAAEIEQLWAALWIMAGRTNDVIRSPYQGVGLPTRCQVLGGMTDEIFEG